MDWWIIVISFLGGVAVTLIVYSCLYVASRGEQEAEVFDRAKWGINLPAGCTPDSEAGYHPGSLADPRD